MRKSVIKIKAVASDVVRKHNGIYRPPEDRRRERTLYISAAILSERVNGVSWKLPEIDKEGVSRSLGGY